MEFFAKKIEEETKALLSPNETVVLTMKQRLISSFTPSFVIATNRRIIIINNSFWGLYAKRNITTPTNYNNILYRQITSVILIRGKILCSIVVRLLGGLEKNPTKGAINEGEIDGLSEKNAVKLINFVESQVERNEMKKEEEAMHAEVLHTIDNNHQSKKDIRLSLYYALTGLLDDLKVKIDEVTLSEANNLVTKNDTRFVWLGTEPPEEISDLLGIGKSRIMKIHPDDIPTLDKSLLENFTNHVFICYNGNLSKFISKYLKKEYAINSYSLKGGVIGNAMASQLKALKLENKHAHFML